MRNLLILFSAAAVIIAVSSFCIFSGNNETELPSIENAKKVMADSAVQTTLEDTYLIKKYGEKIGVFRKGAGKPFKIIDTFVFTLPQNDISMLSHGFTVYENELVGIFEDYSS